MSTATSDGCQQKLENDVRRDSESIASKVCSPISRKWNATCQRKWRNRSELSSTAATTDGGAQMLGNNVWNDYESIATNVCSQIGRRLRSQMKCYVWKPCRDQHWQIELAASIFDLKIFWAIFLCKQSSTVLLTNHPYLVFKDLFQVLGSHFFLGWWAARWAMRKNCANWKYLNSNCVQPMSNVIRCINQSFAFKNSGIAFLALIFALSYPRLTILHAKKLLQVARHFK